MNAEDLVEPKTRGIKAPYPYSSIEDRKDADDDERFLRCQIVVQLSTIHYPLSTEEIGAGLAAHFFSG